MRGLLQNVWYFFSNICFKLAFRFREDPQSYDNLDFKLFYQCRTLGFTDRAKSLRYTVTVNDVFRSQSKSMMELYCEHRWAESMPPQEKNT